MPVEFARKSRMLTAPRRGTWFCEVTPRTPLPDLVLSFSARDRSPVRNAFLDVIRKNCPDVGAALDHRLGPLAPQEEGDRDSTPT